MNNVFPSRKEILQDLTRVNNISYQNKLVNEIKEIDTSKIVENDGNFKPRTSIIEKQKVYFWVRLYLSDEITVSPNDTISITYVPTGETLETTFICYSKRGLDRDNQDEIVNYSSEDDKKVLCLMVDSERIDKNSSDIPFIRSLFKISRYYDYQLLRRTDLTFKLKGDIINYYDCDF